MERMHTAVPGNSRQVVSRQTGPHEDLFAEVAKHARHRWARPIADYNRQAFAAAEAWLAGRPQPLILDSGCGTGDSTRLLAARHPTHSVIGIDRSADRLSRQRGGSPENCLLLRADLVDFWRLARAAGWRPERHYLLYPNPEPKPKHLKRRFHAHPVFPDLVALGGHFESRSNWRIYLEELALALEFHGRPAEIVPVPESEPPLTLFERKYRASGQPLWCLRTTEGGGASA
ncbi:SAM-dependent methyltransferase [Halothiobacillus diazotrophicus]|uniref:tRNA (guanine(46)-N(7))-methyltransferase n=1 Tax=Halothiobacillus diazotrophicus TaxID=1860122 RepID=A0A191ZG00_9GAMM|nr:methyltransferase domain-containing protein [Halothiobacillus diazotrophicus]ANJ66809.1 SAM-dependent methyltransferase [Halothiobacillus diazotrophicus]